MCDIETAKAEGAIAVLALFQNAGVGQRLIIARAMRNDPLLRKLVSRGVNYIMGDRHREAAFWKLLAIKLGGEPIEQSYLVALKRLRRAESRGPHITAGLS
ncbi:hypothetical protein [Ectopseudomonas oleovorans]|jgi:hypothetical protein|uniref:hypothetical protein n=1 Tax=Ectopseudomonas oleovorans TaxID=301 RepID=UPI000DB0EDCA|nr:hypothetical protein [Pseudomonas oleovorans]PZP80576.1 MAG: hypothetical protein DI578_12970 [Pseudomonas oleovorans]